MPTIRVLTNTAASPNGIQVNVYEAGRSYELPEELARVFVREGWGVEVLPNAPLEETSDAVETAPAKPGRKRKVTDGDG
jgi:hypothetical protein